MQEYNNMQPIPCATPGPPARPALLLTLPVSYPTAALAEHLPVLNLTFPHPPPVPRLWAPVAYESDVWHVHCHQSRSHICW